MAAQTSQKSGGHLLDKPLDKGLSSVDFDPATMGMAPISAEMLLPGEEVPTDLFIALYNTREKRVDMQAVCPKGEVFEARWREKLTRMGQKKLYVRLGDAATLNDYYQRFAGRIIDTPGTGRRKKVGLIQEMAVLNLNLIFGQDVKPRALETGVNQAQNMVARLAYDPLLLTKLSSVLRSDYDVYTHSVNVCMLAMAFGKHLGLNDAKIRTLGMGGMLHDIGMSLISSNILYKKDPLTSHEISRVRRHPLDGYQMLLHISAVPYDVLMIVRHHHENADGSGYPSGLKAARTPYLARLIKVVDAYDAMTSQRVYHDPQPAFNAASNLMESMNDQFGADIVPAFIRFLASPFVAES